MTDRIFYDDTHMRYLLSQQSVRYTNVYENQWGDKYFGASMRKPLKPKPNRNGRAVYRIIVRAKQQG